MRADAGAVRAALSLALASLCALPAQALYQTPVSAPVFESDQAPAVLQARMPAAAPFILDPGHGGRDLGAVVHGLREKDIALAIALKVEQKLAADGMAARLTRDSDFFVPLNERVVDYEQGEAFISLHLNEVRGKKASGITVYAFGRGRMRSRRRRHLRHHRKVPPLPAPPKAEARASAVLAQSIVRSLRARGFKVDPPAHAGFYVLKNPAVPSVLIEMGYLSNPREAKRLAQPAYQDKLAGAIAASLQAYAVAEASDDDSGGTAEANAAGR